MKWKKKNQIKAIKQGWMVCLNGHSNKHEIQKVDDKFMFDYDEDVWLMLSKSNKKLHKKALRYIKKVNQKEYSKILIEYIRCLKSQRKAYRGILNFLYKNL